jgi:hypothetical protein
MPLLPSPLPADATRAQRLAGMAETRPEAARPCWLGAAVRLRLPSRTLQACRVDASHPRVSRRGGVSMAGVRLGVARNHSRLHRAGSGDRHRSSPTSVCPTGSRQRRSDRTIIKPDQTPLLRFLSLSALSGRVALAGVAKSRPIPGRTFLPAVFRFSALRGALGSVRHVPTVKCSPRVSAVLPHWPPSRRKRPLSARGRHQSCERLVVISRRRLANQVGLSQDRACCP